MNKTIQKHVLKGKRIYVGLEDAKKTWNLCVRSEGIVAHACSMPARYEHLRNYFRNRFPACEIRVMYEAGFGGFNLYDKLIDDGWECVVVPPHTVVQEKCSRLKNDRIDCRRLAKNNERSDYRACAVPDRQRREDRQVSRRYEQLKKNVIRTRNRIRKAIEFHGLDDYVLPGAWTERQYKELEQLTTEMDLSASLRFSMQNMFAELKMLCDLKKKTVEQLKSLADRPRYKRAVTILKSAPGIGTLTAVRLVLEWGDVSRFKRKEDFNAYLGMIPSEYSTGEKIRLGHITKQGSSCVRSWLVEAAWLAKSRDPVLLKKYRDVLSRTNSSKKAIVAVARKLAVRLRALLISGEEYQVGVVQ